MHHPRTNFWTNGGHYIHLNGIKDDTEPPKKDDWTEEIMKIENWYKNVKMTKVWNPKEVRYVNTDKIYVHTAPNDESPVNPRWSYVSRGNAIEVIGAYDNGYALCQIGDVRTNGVFGYLKTYYMSKTPVK